MLKAKTIPISIGGDHSITFPIIRGFNSKWKKKLGFIQIDAHLDLRPGALEGRLSNGTPMRGILEEGLIDPDNLVQVGARDFVNEEDWAYAKRKGVHIFQMTEIEERGLVSIIEEALQLVWNSTDGVYLSFDIDALDPCHAPGTGSPTFGGDHR